MKSAQNHQERIHSILNKIDEELSSMKQIECPTLSESNEEFKMIENYKQRAIKAYKQKKIFTIYGNYITIRRALVQRGWVEKCAPGHLQSLEKLSISKLLKGARRGNVYEMAILSKFVQSFTPNFIWQPKYLRDQYVNLNPLRNRVRRTRYMDFSTKIGLISCLEKSHWNTIEDVSETAYMPSYNLATKEDEIYFLNEFRITQCISFLMYFIEYQPPSDLFDKFGLIPKSVIEYPVKSIENYIKNLEKDDIVTDEWKHNTNQWEDFNVKTQLILKKDQKIVGTQVDAGVLLIQAQLAIKKVQAFKPFLFAYGVRNLWILKPGFQCRGQGIVIMDNFDNIIHHAASRLKARYVVQKYIERPFLIYRTKFDIRQYMLLTICDTISIWMYKDCYLRFSSREFSLRDLRESIHITNNSIQKKYTNMEQDSRLPKHHMWHLSELETFFSKNDHEKVWSDKIYPGFKKNLISVVLSSLEETDITSNTFELYGCDFMLDERLDPFLIEINSTPDMTPSTPVTAKICPAVLADVIKVVIDHTRNPRISTGNFELIYQIDCPSNYNTNHDLLVAGTVKPLHSPAKTFSSRHLKKLSNVKRKIFKKFSTKTNKSKATAMKSVK